jgi:hypothetical protein
MAAARVAAPVAHLVSFKVIKGLVSMLRVGTLVAVVWIETVINVALEVVGAVEPGADSDEHAAVKPLRPVIPIRRAIVGFEIVVAVRALRFYADIDGDLRRWGDRNAQQSCKQGSNDKKYPIAHEFLLTLEGSNPDAKIAMAGRL